MNFKKEFFNNLIYLRFKYWFRKERNENNFKDIIRIFYVVKIKEN